MYLYHICREQDKHNLSKGYLGISKNKDTLKARWACHRKGSSNIHLTNAYSRYDDIIEYIVECGSPESITELEHSLRPSKNMGWNIATGGGVPPSGNRLGSKHTESTKALFSLIRVGNTNRKGTKTTEVGKLNISKGRRGIVPVRDYDNVSDSTKLKMSQARKGRFKGTNNPRFKGWYSIDGVLYETSGQAAKFIGITCGGIRSRVRSEKFTNYKFIPKGDLGTTDP